MLKRITCISAILILIMSVRSYACGPYYSPDNEYYNLFMQELIDDPVYFPFLLSYDARYYQSDTGFARAKNENIEQWEHYLGLNYEQTEYLVFLASLGNIEALMDGKKVDNENLHFITADFVKKHRNALQYLAYAKELEPYMKISGSNDSWYAWEEDIPYSADQLDYATVVNELNRRWMHSDDKEMKLRYGYQLVRFAHYNRRYEESVSFFDRYVESLDYKPAIYYHALSQKAGAERGYGDTESSVWDFFRVFVHSRDLKKKALSSIRFNDQVEFDKFFEKAQTLEERNNIYLLLGYFSFNNPLAEVEHIIRASPDAIQAKLLIARSINEIERNIMPIWYWGNPDMVHITNDKRYPLVNNDKISGFLDQTLELVDRMTVSEDVKDKNYWYITASYLYFLRKDFERAEQLLGQVNPVNELYEIQKQNLEIYIDVCKHPQITASVENELYGKYKSILTSDLSSENYTDNHRLYSTKGFVLDVLANRYYIQKDYAKSFLLSNRLTTLENYPQLMLLRAIDTFYHKADRNEWDNYILSAAIDGVENVGDYLQYLYGIIYLTHGELEIASRSFAETNYSSKLILPATIFGYNRIECFECANIMDVDYLSDFSFILPVMDFKTLTTALVKLDKIAKSEKKLAAKANYLLGNFFYNVSEGGYFRHVLRFGTDNGGYSLRYGLGDKPDLKNQIYFKYYRSYYDDPSPIAQAYLEKAYEMTSDNEMKARIAFALSKCELLAHDLSKNYTYIWSYQKGSEIPISNRKYFHELMLYRETAFFDVVQTNCKYFDYYVTQVAGK